MQYGIRFGIRAGFNVPRLNLEPQGCISSPMAAHRTPGLELEFQGCIYSPKVAFRELQGCVQKCGAALGATEAYLFSLQPIPVHIADYGCCAKPGISV